VTRKRHRTVRCLLIATPAPPLLGKGLRVPDAQQLRRQMSHHCPVPVVGASPNQSPGKCLRLSARVERGSPKWVQESDIAPEISLFICCNDSIMHFIPIYRASVKPSLCNKLVRIAPWPITGQLPSMSPRCQCVEGHQRGNLCFPCMIHINTEADVDAVANAEKLCAKCLAAEQPPPLVALLIANEGVVLNIGPRAWST